MNYQDMVNGNGDVNNSLDYGQVSGINNQAKATASKKNSTPVNKELYEKCKVVMKSMSEHKYIHLFNTPSADIQDDLALAGGSPSSHVTFAMIDSNFKLNKYENTFNLALDIRKMCTQAYQTYVQEPQTYSKISEISVFFEN